MRLQTLALAIASAVASSWPAITFSTPATPPVLTPHLAGYEYLSPIPGSQLVSPWNDIVIRHRSAIDGSTIDDRAVSVVGSASGNHTGRLTLSRDMRTVRFAPDRPFSLGETVEVRLEQGVKTPGGEDLPALSFTFSVSPVDPKQRPRLSLESLVPELASARTASRSRAPGPAALANDPEPGGGAGNPTGPECDELPPGAPAVPVLSSNDPMLGDLFLAPFYGSIPGAYLLIVDNLGMPMFYRAIPDGFGALDFKRQPNGLLTYFLGTPERYYALDSTYAVVDSFATGNGYPTDLHELQLLPDGHALLMSYDREPVDMSAVVPGGNPNAWVTGLIVQELDAAKNVVFQWRSWDHFAFTDLASPDIALTDSLIDYVHGNAIELDQDGNLLISSRHMNEITKVNRQTGDIIWRLGRNAVNNQFTFVNDSRGFSHQHDIRRLSNGHITLFDNGNFLSPQYSRALEYDLDEANKVATLVWEYRDTPDVYGGFMGNAQRHADGTTTIGWGGNFGALKLTDLHADGSKALGMGIEDAVHLWWSYRAFRFPWQTTRFVTDADSLPFGTLEVGDTVRLPLTVRNTTGAPLTISCAFTTDSAFTVPTLVPWTLEPGETVPFEVAFAPSREGEYRATLYLREISEHEIVARSVALGGAGAGQVAAVGTSDSELRLRAGRPNPFARGTTVEFDLPRAGRVRLEILDVRGRRIDVLVDGVRDAGRHEVTWSPAGAASGVYFCRLEAGGRTVTRKLALTR